VVKPPLTLAARLDIAVGVAEALKYLHSFTKPTIIHRDIMSSTVLLDSSLQPKLCGLGLLKHLPGRAWRLRMASKKGYLDPESFRLLRLQPSATSDSFGVVLLEMLTGCAPIIQVTRATQHRPMTLPQWVSPSLDTVQYSTVLGRDLVLMPGTDLAGKFCVQQLAAVHWTSTRQFDCSDYSCVTVTKLFCTGLCHCVIVQALQAVEENMFLDILDPRMGDVTQKHPKELIEAFAKIACALRGPLRKDRPDMAKVAYLLGELKKGPSARTLARNRQRVLQAAPWGAPGGAHC